MPPTLQATLPHFELVNHQLRQLRVLFALAQVGRPAERVCTEGQRLQYHAPPQQLLAACSAPGSSTCSPQAVRPTLAVSFCPLQMTGRAVILPALWCGMGRDG